MANIHISEADAVLDFAAILAHIRAGTEVIIESGTRPVAVIRPATSPIRTISESIARSALSAKALGYEPRMGAEYADDLDEIIQKRAARRPSAWD